MAKQDAAESLDTRLGLVLGGRYLLCSRLASGAMGVVYEALHESLERRVAVKCLHPHLAASPSFVTRFMREAHLASRLMHPNIVRIYDFGTEQTTSGVETYLVMEYCPGRELGALVAQGGRFALARVRSIMG